MLTQHLNVTTMARRFLPVLLIPIKAKVTKISLPPFTRSQYKSTAIKPRHKYATFELRCHYTVFVGTCVSMVELPVGLWISINTLCFLYTFNRRDSYEIYTITSFTIALCLQRYHSLMLVLRALSDILGANKMEICNENEKVLRSQYR